jgi:microcystin-dependent protein
VPGTQDSPQNGVPAEAPLLVYANDMPILAMDANSTTHVGGSRSHTNMMPYLCVSFIIALFGIFPSRS